MADFNWRTLDIDALDPESSINFDLATLTPAVQPVSSQDVQTLSGQIKQLITILENSLEMRHAAKHQSRPLKDDRNILQLISSGLQVAKILKDPRAMQYLDSLYVQTERLIQGRRATIQPASFGGI